MHKSILAGCVIPLLCMGIASATRAEQPPNIVFAFADDWGRYAGAYARLEPGGPGDLVRTPHFDELARQGVLFANAFVNAPSCTPCRSSLLSGQYFWRTGLGAILQGARWDDNIPSYPLLLEQAGYKIGHTYKVWSPGSPADQPHGGKRTSYNSAGRKFNRFSQYVQQAPDKDAARHELLLEVRANFSDFLEDRDGSQPFCYWFGPTNCHRQWVQGSGKVHWGLEPEQLKGKLPGYLPDVPIVREDFCDYLGEVQAFDAGLGVLLDELAERGLTENTMVVVSGDHGIPGIPRGKCNLYDLGTRVPLVICWPGKTGQGLVVEDFVSLPDLAPTFLQAAGVARPPVMTARSLVPLLQAKVSGVVDPSRDHIVVGRERHVAQARAGALPYPQRAIRTAEFLYIRNFKPDRWPMGTAPGFGLPDDTKWPAYEQLRDDTFSAFGDLDASPTKAWMLTQLQLPSVAQQVALTMGLRPEEELFDIRVDVDQLHNLADEPSLAEVKQSLKSRLMGILESSGDPRVVGDGAAFDLPPYVLLDDH